MSNPTNSAANDRTTKRFLSYVIPSVLGMLVSGLYQVIDGYFVGQYVGADGLAAINLSWPMIGCIYGLGMMVGIGGGALSSIARGECNNEQAKKFNGMAISLVFALALVLSIVLLASGNMLLTLQGAIGNALALAEDYLFIVYLSAPIAASSVALPFLVRNDEHPTRATLIVGFGALANVILDILLVAVMGMGVVGAALATVAAQFSVTFLGLIHFSAKCDTDRLRISELKIKLEEASEILTLGFSSFFMYMYISFVVGIHNYLFMYHADATYVGAYAIVGYITALYFLLAEGIVSGSQPLISYEYGAQNIARVRSYSQKMFLCAIGSGAIITVAINVFVDPIVSFFNSTDQALYQATSQGLRLHLLALGLDGLIFAAGVFFQSLGLGDRATIVSMANMAIQIPFIAVLPIVYGVEGIWLAVPLSNIALSLVVIWWLIREWKAVAQDMQLPKPTALRS